MPKDPAYAYVWAGLNFYDFPILPVVTGWLTAWHLLIDILL